MASALSSNLVILIPDRLALNYGNQSEIFVLDQILESLGAEIRRFDASLLDSISQDVDVNLHAVHRFCDNLASRISQKESGLLVFTAPIKHRVQASFLLAAFMILHCDYTTADALRKLPCLKLSESKLYSSSNNPSVLPFMFGLLRLSKERLTGLVHATSTEKNPVNCCKDGPIVDEEKSPRTIRQELAREEDVEARWAWCGEGSLTAFPRSDSSHLFRSPRSPHFFLARSRSDGSGSRESGVCGAAAAGLAVSGHRIVV